MGNVGESGCVRSSTLPAERRRFSPERSESARATAGVIAPASIPAARCIASRRLSPARAVAITEGPFTDFNGTVEEVMADKGKVRVSVSLFGRPTSVELDYLQLKGY